MFDEFIRCLSWHHPLSEHPKTLIVFVLRPLPHTVGKKEWENLFTVCRHQVVHGVAGKAIAVAFFPYTAACFGLSHPHRSPMS